MRLLHIGIVTLLLAGSTGCTSPAPKANVLEHYSIVERIRVREMPSRLVELYKVQGSAAEPSNAGFYYRPGTLDSEIGVYRTSHGLVYVDFGGGGQAFAVECAALTDFVNRNGWNRASGCLDGQR